MSTPEDIAHEGRREMWLDSLPVLGTHKDCGGTVRDEGDGPRCGDCDELLKPEQIEPAPDTLVSVTFTCSECGTVRNGEIEHRLVGHTIGTVCFKCMRSKPHRISSRQVSTT